MLDSCQVIAAKMKQAANLSMGGQEALGLPR